MLVKKILVVLFALSAFGAINLMAAEDDIVQPEKPKTFKNRLDNFGKALFGGILPAEKPKTQTPAQDVTTKKKIEKPSANKSSVNKPSVTLPSNDEADAPRAINQRAGSILTDHGSTGKPFVGTKITEDPDFTPENTPPATNRGTDDIPKPSKRPAAKTPTIDESDVVEQPVVRPQPVVKPSATTLNSTRRSASATVLVDEAEPADKPAEEAAIEPVQKPTAATAPSDSTIELSAMNKVKLRPLHERLSGFRQSAFSENAGKSTPQPNLLPKHTTETSDAQPQETDTASPTPATRSMTAQRATPEANTTESPDATPETPKPEAPASVAENAAPVAAQDNDGLLITRKSPVLSVETLGPRRISVGKESTYEVNIVNSGEVAAEDMLVFVSLPDWAEVTGAQASSGTAQASAAGRTTDTIQWKLGHLDAKGRERLTLKIIPRQSRPFDLAVRWELRPVASQAAIEVQEAKLALRLEGPREVFYGKREVFRLKLANTGNGAAENITILLMPIGGGENVPARHQIGTLQAGAEKSLDIELTARQAGSLTIQVDARADGNVRTELSEKVLVRRAGLKLDVEGPRVQFVGTTTSYAIRVRNTGTAAARHVSLSFALPAGAKYLGGIDDAKLDSSGNKLNWKIANINPEVEQSFVVKCSLASAGMSRIQVNATADDDLTTSATTTTRVESVANLTMDVKDPEGPSAVGDEVVYEVHVRNRGTREATGVEVLGYFSRGIEPISTEGAPSRLGPGQVVFQPIPLLAPGAEVVFKIRARAEAAGNHVFRAEAHCRPLNARLVREASNLYYVDSPVASRATDDVAAEQSRPAPLRTVNRPSQAQPVTPVRK